MGAFFDFLSKIFEVKMIYNQTIKTAIVYSHNDGFYLSSINEVLLVKLLLV